jgi:predicted amidohydrolase YtcJ
VTAALARPGRRAADVAIVGGEVYSGADAPAIVGDVVIIGDKVVAVGAGAAADYAAKTTIDARGKIVSPGLIDG